MQLDQLYTAEEQRQGGRRPRTMIYRHRSNQHHGRSRGRLRRQLQLQPSARVQAVDASISVVVRYWLNSSRNSWSNGTRQVSPRRRLGRPEHARIHEPVFGFEDAG